MTLMNPTTNTEAVVVGDNTHPWVSRYGIEICGDCGIVRRRDRMNSPCKGKVKVALRDTEGEV